MPPVQGGSTLSSTTAQLVPPLLCLLSPQPARAQAARERSLSCPISFVCIFPPRHQRKRGPRRRAETTYGADGSLTCTSLYPSGPGWQAAVGWDRLGSKGTQCHLGVLCSCCHFILRALCVEILCVGEAPSCIFHHNTWVPATKDPAQQALELIHSGILKKFWFAGFPQKNLHSWTLSCTFEILFFLLSMAPLQPRHLTSELQLDMLLMTSA